MRDVTSDRLILALDVPSADEAKRLLERVGSEITFVKIGTELFTAAGPEIVRWVIQQGKRVFLDLKLLDIGETVKKTVSAAAELGVTFLTVHAGRKAIRAATEGRSGRPLQIIVVTVLTNFDDSDLSELGIKESLIEAVQRRAKMAMECGADGVVAAGTHVKILRALIGRTPRIITPGIRPAKSLPDDQVNITTPALALQAGADYLVVGRPIRNAADPLAAARAIQAEIAEQQARMG